MVRPWLRRLAPLALFAATGALGQQLSIDPPKPSALDTVRLRYAHVGCTDPASVQVSQEANEIRVAVDRGGISPDCGTVAGFYEEYTLGRLPAGEYDASLIVNPLPGTSGPSELLGPVHLSVAPAAAGSLHPHDDFSDMWWNPREPGWALAVHQLGEKLFIMWLTYEEPGKSAWLVLPGGSWSRDDQGLPSFSGKVYRTQGTPWQQPFDPAATHLTPVGTASFTPLDASHGVFRYTVDGTGGSKMIERFRF